MLLLLIITLGIFGGGSCETIADQYLDSIIGKPLEQLIKDMHLDPAPLPDFRIPFKFRLGLVPISGRVDFTNGVFNGLSKIRRFAQCQGPDISLKELKLECGLKLFGMSVVYDARVRVGVLGVLPSIPFQVTAYVNETHVRSVISVAPASGFGQLKLFEITKFGDINVRLSNLGIFQYLYNAVEERFRKKIRELIIAIILNQFAAIFRKAITQVILPKFGLK